MPKDTSHAVRHSNHGKPMSKKLRLAPEFLTETWKFLTEPASHISDWMDPQNEAFYAPWSTFISGVGLSVGLLAVQASQAAYFFDSVAMFLVIVLSGAAFFIAFYFAARSMGGKVTSLEMLCAAEYLFGFLIAIITVVAFLAVTIINLFPGVRCVLGYFRIVCDIVPTNMNILLQAFAATCGILALVYGIYRSYLLLHKLARLSAARTAIAMLISMISTVILQGQIEFVARITAVSIHDEWKVLTGS